MFILLAQDQVQEVQDKVDRLSADYATQTRHQMELSDTTRELEQEAVQQMELVKKSKSGSPEHKKHSQTLKFTNRKLADVRNELAALRLKLALTSEHLQEAENELHAKLGQAGSQKS